MWIVIVVIHTTSGGGGAGSIVTDIMRHWGSERWLSERIPAFYYIDKIEIQAEEVIRIIPDSESVLSFLIDFSFDMGVV